MFGQPHSRSESCWLLNLPTKSKFRQNSTRPNLSTFLGVAIVDHANKYVERQLLGCGLSVVLGLARGGNCIQFGANHHPHPEVRFLIQGHGNSHSAGFMCTFRFLSMSDCPGVIVFLVSFGGARSTYFPLRHVGLRKVFLVFLEFREQPGIPVFEGTSGGSRLQAAGCRLCS